MLEITVLGTGSTGNGYLLSTEKETILLECGMPTRTFLKSISYNVGRIQFGLATHAHFDHVGHIKEYLKYGFPIYMTDDTAVEGVSKIRRMQRFTSGGFFVVPFGVPHSETACDGFLIRHQDFGTLLFLTDAEMCPYNLSGQHINHAMVECNYSTALMDFDAENKNHIYGGHMELQTCKRFIRSIASDELKSIGLIHLSAAHADPDGFRKEISDIAPNADVWVAKNNMTRRLT